MNITYNDLEHPFKYSCLDLNELFNGVDNFPKFRYRLMKQADLMDTEERVLKYLGDGFEFFVECLFKIMGYANNVGITDYHPVLNDDNGVDGYGTNIYGNKCVVQIKFRADITTPLSFENDHLINMYSDAMIKHDVHHSDNVNENRYFIFTNTKGVFISDHHKIPNNTEIFHLGHITEWTKNHITFWNKIRQIINTHDDRPPFY